MESPTPPPAAEENGRGPLVIDEFGGVPFTEAETIIKDFVALHAGGHRQRTEGWLAMKVGSIGGSEIAALMGLNPYSSFDEVIASKVGARTFAGNIACRWGTMFESVIERYVEIDCGTRLAGTDISVPAPGSSGLRGRHSNSPDGYAAITLFAGEGAGGAPEWHILTTDGETRAAAAGRGTKRITALFEFKCPYRRQPKGNVPKHYTPQIWSGLALSPIAHLGVFVDAVFRKCALWNLGPRPGYDASYHRERRVAHWSTPVAWGLTAIYAPRLDAPSAPCAGGAPPPEDFLIGEAATSAAYEAWSLSFQAFGIPQEPTLTGHPFAPDPIDFGSCETRVFEDMMLHLDKGRFQAIHRGPCFPDGRGVDLRTEKSIGGAVDLLAASAPNHHYLLGVLPWKMLEVDYAFVERREGFLEEVAPLVHECLDTVERLRREKDPTLAYRAYLENKRAKKSGGTPAHPDTVPEHVQDIFDMVSTRC